MDWIEKQAIMFRNYPLLHPQYRAVVHLEDKDDEKRRLNEFGIDETNAYLHIRGHNLFDLLKYIGLLLTKGLQVSFYKEILTTEVFVEAYWERNKIEADIKEILKV